MQRRSLRPVIARFVVPSTTALVGAWALIVLNANPLCALYTPDNVEYWWFMCWLTP